MLKENYRNPNLLENCRLLTKGLGKALGSPFIWIGERVICFELTDFSGMWSTIRIFIYQKKKKRKKDVFNTA